MDVKKTIASIIALVVITGGVVVGLSRPDELTYEDGLLVREIYSHEIQQRGGSVTFEGGKNALENLHDILLTREITASTTIRGQELSSTTYSILRSALFIKVEQKSLFDNIL